MSRVSSEPDRELEPGARNAIRSCLRLQPEERLVLITDRETLPIAEALQHEAAETNSAIELWVLENFVDRPTTCMPDRILKALEKADVSIFVAQARPGELQMRMQMMEVVNRRRIRHAHMVNINRQIMLEGMRADFEEIDRLSRRLIARARKATTIRCSTPAGTELEARFSPKLKWLKTSGIISRAKWGNLPGGEIFTSPDHVEGVFVADGVVGDHLCRKYGSLADHPLKITIDESRIRQVSCPSKELLKDFREYTSTDPNSDRVGEFAIGTNLAVRRVVGNILQDEKIPGVHIAFGHPYSEHTGQTWTSTTHIDCVGRDFDIWIDGEKVMASGLFLI